MAAKTLYQDIDLGHIEIKLGKKSDGQASYMAFDFKFSDLTLKTLSNQIDIANTVEDDEDEEADKKDKSKKEEVTEEEEK